MAPRCYLDSVDISSNLQNISMPKSITTGSPGSSSVCSEDAETSTVSDCVVDGRVLNPLAVTSRSSVCADRVSAADKSLPLGAPMLYPVMATTSADRHRHSNSEMAEEAAIGVAKDLVVMVTASSADSHHHSNRDTFRPMSSVNSTSASALVDSMHSTLISFVQESANCRSIVTTPSLQSSVSRSFSSLNNSSSLCSQCRGLPPCTACQSHASSVHIITPALNALVSKAAALTKQFPVTTDSRCDNVVTSSCSVPTHISATRPSPAFVKTSSASLTFTQTSSIISSAVLSFTSADVVSMSCSSPSALISNCRSIVTASGNPSSLMPPPQPSLQSHYQSPMVRPSPLPDKGLRPQSGLPSSSGVVAPFLSRLSFPEVTVPPSAAVCCKPTGISNDVYVSTTEISNEGRSCTRSTTGVSNQVHTCTVSAASMISQRVEMHDVPAVGISNQVSMHTVPTLGVSSPVYSCTANTVSISSPLYVCTTSPTVHSDRLLMATLPTLGISDKSHIRTVPYFRSSDAVCQRNVPSTPVEVSENTTPTLTVSSKQQSSSTAPRTRRVLPPATGCSTRQTHSLSSTSLPSPLSICGPVLSTFQTAVKPPALLAPALSPLSPTRPDSVAGMAMSCRSNHHYRRSPQSVTGMSASSRGNHHSVIHSQNVTGMSIVSRGNRHSLTHSQNTIGMSASSRNDRHSVTHPQNVTGMSATSRGNRRSVTHLENVTGMSAMSRSIRHSLTHPQNVTRMSATSRNDSHSPTHSQNATGMSSTSRNDRHFLDSFMSLKPLRGGSSSTTQPGRLPSSSVSSSTVTGNYILLTTSSRNPIAGSCHMEAISIPLSRVSTTSSPVDASSVTLTPYNIRDVARPTFVLFSPHCRPVVEKIALRLSSHKLPSNCSAQISAKINDTCNTVSDFLCSRAASAAHGATESVVKATTSPVDRRHGYRVNRCSTDRGVTADVGVNKASESVAMVTASIADCRHLSNSGIDCHGNRELVSLAADVTVATESVVMVTTSHRCHGDTENHHHSNVDVCSVIADTASHNVPEPVVMVTKSPADYRHHSNREVISLADKTAGDVTKTSVVMATSSSVDNRCYSNGTTANNVAMESVVMATTSADHHRHSNSEMAEEATVSVAKDVVVMATASSADSHHHSNRQTVRPAETMMAAGAERKSKRKLKLCLEVTTSVPLIITFCL